MKKSNKSHFSTNNNRIMQGIKFILLAVVLFGCQNNKDQFTEVLLSDDFSSIRRGPYSFQYDAHTEYQYIHQAVPRSQWEVSTFAAGNSAFQRAWHVRGEVEGRYFVQTLMNDRGSHTHPMLVAGKKDWEDYSVELQFTPESKVMQSGLVFRYRNDRCYYFAGVKGDSLILKMVKHATGYHQPYEEILGSAELDWETNKLLTLRVDVRGNKLSCKLNNVKIEAEDNTYSEGRVGLMADVPTKFHQVEVKTSNDEVERIEKEAMAYEKELEEIREPIPGMKLWKKVNISGFGVGRNLRFGDLNNNGEIDILVGQVIHYGPKGSRSELSCLTALTFDGEILWQKGTPDPWKNHLTNDVAFQVHDLDNDGKTEVVYCMNQEMIVADGATGKIKIRKPTPKVIVNDKGVRRAENILGDCVYFCDLEGTGYDQNIIIKDRYNWIWAMDNKLNVLWEQNLNTGHFPYAYDIDNDGKDELAAGYSLLDDDGTMLWTLDNKIEEHSDATIIFKPLKDAEPVVVAAASDDGVVFTDKGGNVIKHHYIGHGQNLAIANFRDDLPGLETISVNFWGNQGIIHFYNAQGDIYHDFEPTQYGSMCLPINWTGGTEELFILSPNVDEGGVFDGWGRKVLEFPDDGHPDMCNAVVDLTGDYRGEIVVWDPHSIWVYTQDNTIDSERPYEVVRNELYNSSNYHASFSLPEWAVVNK